jgi:hypothetical protein
MLIFLKNADSGEKLRNFRSNLGREANSGMRGWWSTKAALGEFFGLSAWF